MAHRALISSSKLALFGLGAGLAWGIARNARRISFRDKVVLITGGSRGLGLLIARRLAAEGAQLALVARDADELRRARDELASQGGRVETIPADICSTDDIKHAVHETLSRLGRIDVLINDAGVIQVGPLEHMDREDFNQAMQVHFWGPLHAMLEVMPHMRAQGGGRIVNISSIGGKMAVPHLAPYCASKFALVGLSDAIRHEVRKDNIYVTTVCPGLMRTGSIGNAFFKGKHRKEFTWFAISGSLPGVSVNADRAAAKVIETCRHGSPSLIIGLPAKAGALMYDVMPALTAEILALVNRLLPRAKTPRDLASYSGWQSTSRLAPSVLTSLSDRAAVENNELATR
jgi:short-subunit dehydrogenase